MKKLITMLMLSALCFTLIILALSSCAETSAESEEESPSVSEVIENEEASVIEEKAPADEELLEESIAPTFAVKVPGSYKKSISSGAEIYDIGTEYNPVAAYAKEQILPANDPTNDVQYQLGDTAITRPDANFQFRTSCRIISTFGDKIITGTGTMIGPGHIFTAGHNLFIDGVFPDKVIIIPAMNSDETQPYGQFLAVSVEVSADFYHTKNSYYDWGIVELEKAIGDTIGWQGLYFNENSWIDQKINTQGYPSGRTLMTSSGTVSGGETYFINSNALSVSGMSGGAMTIWKNNQNYLSGCVQGSYMIIGEQVNIQTKFDIWLFNKVASYRPGGRDA